MVPKLLAAPLIMGMLVFCIASVSNVIAQDQPITLQWYGGLGDGSLLFGDTLIINGTVSQGIINHNLQNQTVFIQISQYSDLVIQSEVALDENGAFSLIMENLSKNDFPFMGGYQVVATYDGKYSASTDFALIEPWRMDFTTLSSRPDIHRDDGFGLNIATSNQPIVLLTRVTNGEWIEKPYVSIIDVRDMNDVSVFIGWQAGNLTRNPYSPSEVRITWTPESPGKYLLRTFVVSHLEHPQVLTRVVASQIHVLDSKDIPSSQNEEEFSPIACLVNFDDNDGKKTDSMVAALSDKAWVTPLPNYTGMFGPDRHYWKFSECGQAKWMYSSDYTLSAEGYYRTEYLSNSSGVMFVALEDAYSDTGYTNKVLPFQIDNQSLTLGSKRYIKTDSLAEWAGQDPFSHNRGFMADMLDEHKENTTFSLWASMNSQGGEWSVNEVDVDSGILSVLPEKIRFNKNATYEMEYLNGCKFGGLYVMETQDAAANNVYFVVPERDCDPRGYNDGFVWGTEIRFENDILTLNGLEYFRQTIS